MHHLPRSTLPGPGPCEFAELGWRNILPVDLQRRRSSHGESLSGMFRAPHSDVLLEPFRPEPQLRSLEWRFERDLDLPALEFKLDQLQANRTLAQRRQAQRPHMDAYGFIDLNFAQECAPAHVEGCAMRGHLSRVAH